MLSTIKNASMAKKLHVEVMHTNECESIAKVLKDKGFLSDVKVFKPAETSRKMLSIDIAESAGVPAIGDVKIVSKPGRRVYRKSAELKDVAGGFGIQLVSTPKGVMSGVEAKKQNLGGEVLCEVL